MAGRGKKKASKTAHTDTLNKPQNHMYGAKNGDKVVTQKFKIKPRKKCQVQNVGFRPTLVCKSVDYDVKVCPFNREDGSVEVMVKGKKQNIKKYWRDIKIKKIKPPLDDDFREGLCIDFTVSKLEDRSDMPDGEIDYFIDALQLGQSRRGVRAIYDLDKDIRKTITRLVSDD